MTAWFIHKITHFVNCWVKVLQYVTLFSLFLHLDQIPNISVKFKTQKIKEKKIDEFQKSFALHFDNSRLPNVSTKNNEMLTN